jgi:hypothetical protein
MFANPQFFGLSTPSTNASEVPWGPFGNRSQSATVVGQLVKQVTPEPIQQFVPSIGSLVLGYGKRLIATASAHTILDALSLPIVIEEAEALDFPAESDVRYLTEELEEIEVKTGLNKARIAEDLFGVSRMAYHHWSTGKRVSLENERRIRSTLNVLRHASIRHVGPELLRGWLVTPVGSRAVAPIDLLRAGRLDEARLLAVSPLSRRETALPDWLLSGPLDEWSEREQKRHDFVVRESDAISRVAIED